MSAARQQPQYVHYTGPQNNAHPPPTHTHAQQPTTVSPQDTQHAPPKTTTTAVAAPRVQTAASGSGSGSGAAHAPQPVVAKGNWTKDLVQLAKTAELKYADRYSCCFICELID